MKEYGFEQQPFSSLAGSAEQFAQLIRDQLPERHMRILDVGCGSGDLVRHLRTIRRDLEVVGLDFSPENIQKAKEQSEDEFICSDYLAFSSLPYDVIVSNSVFQFVRCTDIFLANKLSSDLKQQGLLIVNMPISSAVNALLIALRCVWRATPLSFDNMALRIARLVYKSANESALCERLIYLRSIPVRLIGKSFSSALSNAGFRQISSIKPISPSFFKLRHRIVTWTK